MSSSIFVFLLVLSWFEHSQTANVTTTSNSSTALEPTRLFPIWPPQRASYSGRCGLNAYNNNGICQCLMGCLVDLRNTSNCLPVVCHHDYDCHRWSNARCSFNRCECEHNFDKIGSSCWQLDHFKATELLYTALPVVLIAVAVAAFCRVRRRRRLQARTRITRMAVPQPARSSYSNPAYSNPTYSNPAYYPPPPPYTSPPAPLHPAPSQPVPYAPTTYNSIASAPPKSPPQY